MVVVLCRMCLLMLITFSVWDLCCSWEGVDGACCLSEEKGLLVGDLVGEAGSQAAFEEELVPW